MITLLSDFGRKDVYVSIMKAVIAAIAPEIATCDLTHEVPPQDILAGRFNLMVAYPYFPIKTVHLAVVDPGVGSSRRAVAVECSRGFFGRAGQWAIERCFAAGNRVTGCCA